MHEKAFELGILISNFTGDFYIMKKNTHFILFAAGILFLLLAALAIWLGLGQHRMTSKPVSPAESEADAVLQTLHDMTAEQTTAPTSATEVPATEVQSEAAYSEPNATDELRIWVGDSRTLGMERALDGSTPDVFIGAAGEGYDWFAADGLPQLLSAMKAHPLSPVIFNLGVNDYDNLSRYLTLYRSLQKEHPAARFYFLSVNPIDPARCQNITNEEISDFNAQLQELAGDMYIDSYTWIRANDIQTKDGIHYEEDDYRALYKYVKTQIEAFTF